MPGLKITPTNEALFRCWRSTRDGTSLANPFIDCTWSDHLGQLVLHVLTSHTLNNMVPLGDLFPWGGMALGGNLQTAGGLSFIGATMDAYFRAFDVGSGMELWRADVPYAAHAMPMTYRLRPDSKQFVVIASGGKGLFESVGSTTGDALVAFSLPD